jgi:phosphatidylglycerol---prolipoprotein diacylglyceryl transferase
VSGGFVHDIDPIIGTVGGLHLWWYGFIYVVGFLFLHVWLIRGRGRTGLSIGEIHSLSLLFAFGVLVCGRLVEVFFYEWEHYASHPGQIPAYWIGGMSTHGLLLGAVLGTAVFCWTHQRGFFELADELVVPGAFVMGMGRLANFIDGQIVGSVTTVWWAVKFPDAEGFRHPVVLYDGLKNLLLIPLLLLIRRGRPAPGIVFANFILWYGGLRFFIDLLRVYPMRILGLPPGQWFNLSMALLGSALIVHSLRSGQTGGGQPPEIRPETVRDAVPLWAKRLCLALLLAFCLVIPSDWTQDVPARYGKRHPGLRHSCWYPPIPSP